MAKKKDKKPGLTGGDILIAVLIALAGGTAAFLVILIAGSLLAPDFGKSPTADQPPAVSRPIRGTLPSSAPASAPTPAPEPTEPPEEPSNEPEPEQTAEPAQQTAEPTAKPTQAPPPAQTRAPAPTPTKTPAAAPSRTPAQNPGPVVSINPTVPPVRQTQAPTQSGGGTTSNGNGTYTHDFSGGRVLYTTQSNNNNDPVYHTRDCRAARIIPPENTAWYASAQAAINDGRRLCGFCNK